MKHAFVTALLGAFLFLSCNKGEPVMDTKPTIDLKTLPASIVGNYYASVSIEILDDGGEQITATGLCWSLKSDPTINDYSFIAGMATGTYNVNIKNLVPENRYYARAFATNQYGTVYGNRITFITKVLLPYIVNNTVSNITQTSADVKARIPDNGGAKVTERGFIWDTVDVTIASKNKISLGSDTGTFSGTITGLLPATRYYLKSYAVNKSGVTYQPSIFTTLPPPPPTVITTPVTFVGSKAVSGGTITAPAGTVVTERGIIYETYRAPGIQNKVIDGPGTGSFTAIFSPVFGNTIHNVRAYAVYYYGTTISGTVYGQSIQFISPP